MELLIALALTAWSALCFYGGKWHLRWRAYRHQMRATQTAVTCPQLKAKAIAWHRRQLWAGLHLPRFRFRFRRTA
ncbi:hypothetical protein [Micromonospora sp. URMC 103]|uniref:hypothetical protein n=1 Tax=Micromonospora sp. URMC 103 TaxID=3423406 RepID=UPI003F1B4789